MKSTNFLSIIVLLIFLYSSSFCQENNRIPLNISDSTAIQKSKGETKFGYVTFTDKSLEVMIDGTAVENTNQIKVPVGKREFSVWDKMDSSSVKERYFIKQNTNFYINLNKKQFSPRNILASALLPGLGQTLDGSWVKGIIFGLPTLISVGLYIDAAIGYNKEFPGYDRLLRMPIDEDEFFEEFDKLKKRLGELSHKKDKYAAYFAVIYVLNLLDVTIFHSVNDDLEFSTDPIIMPNKEVGFQFNLKLNLN